MMRRIPQATDGSNGADRAAAMATATGARLTISTLGANLSGDEMEQLGRAERHVGDMLEAVSNQSW